MQNQAVTLGQGPQIQNIIDTLAGGKDAKGWANTFMIPMLPIKFVIVPDSRGCLAALPLPVWRKPQTLVALFWLALTRSTCPSVKVAKVPPMNGGGNARG